jgi:hypothetical protein
VTGLTDFWEVEEERVGCSWVKSSSNPSVFFCIADAILALFNHDKTRGLRLLIKWEDINLCDCTKGQGKG